MRDKKKFYVPKKTRNPKVGDVIVKLIYGKEVTISEKDFKHIKDFFKIQRFYGNSSDSAGNVKATSKNFGKQDNFSTENYNEIKTKFEIDEVIGAKDENNILDGNIITHNNYLDEDIIFSFLDWLNLDSSYDLVGLYGINTYTEDDAANGDYVILANGHTLIIKPEDYSKVSSNWEHVDTIVKVSQHEYVEIGGIKWATMNVGANSITDPGLYYQWGDTQGYTAAQVGNGIGLKPFEWGDYKFNPSGDGSTFTKYNSTDGKTVLEAVDDAATVNWGNGWRMPTVSEWQALGTAVDTTWTTDYQNSGVAGLICTDKTDSSKVLFLPVNGSCHDGSIYGTTSGFYWCNYHSTVSSTGTNATFIHSSVTMWGNSSGFLCYGLSVRAIFDDSNTLI